MRHRPWIDLFDALRRSMNLFFVLHCHRISFHQLIDISKYVVMSRFGAIKTTERRRKLILEVGKILPNHTCVTF